MAEIVNLIIHLFRQGIPCLFQFITGLYCPGCGGTRAAISLFHGQFIKSLHYHPLVLYMAVVVVAELVSWGISKIGRNPRLHLRRYDFFVYVGIGIVVVNWIWKNYMLVARGIDLLTLG